MVMKFVKLGLVLVAPIVIVGCGAGMQQKQQSNISDQRTLVSTTEFLPVLKQDKEGVVVPYVPKINPYDKKGRLKKSAVAEFIRARQAFKQARYKQAEKILQNVIHEDSSLSGPWVMLGDIADQENELEEAKKYYLNAIAVNKKNINARLRLALIERKLGQYMSAQKTYAEMLALWPDFPEAHLNLAVLYDIYLNHPIRAQKHLEAYLFLVQGKDAKAQAWLEEVQSRTGIQPSLPTSVRSASVSTSDS